jgi:hypothetical protein
MSTVIESRTAIPQLVQQISDLPPDWHGAGTVSATVLDAIVRHTEGREISHSLETGAGKTTLLFSHLSTDHRVFAKENENRSITVVLESPLLNRGVVDFIEGPTQQTLARYEFPAGYKLQLALLDGPHGYPFPELEYYYVYPHLDAGALLIVDDIHIPTIYRMFEVLREDEMFELVEVVGSTGFLRRTNAPVFAPLGDGWWMQNFNTRRMSAAAKPSATQRVRSLVGRVLPAPVKRLLKG